jgi:hypothetical protein
VRGKSELYAVACFVTRALMLGFVCYSLKFYLKDQAYLCADSILYKLRLNVWVVSGVKV